MCKALRASLYFQARYRWDTGTAEGASGHDPAAVRTIKALEIEHLFDPTSTGFADLAGAKPVLTTKARITMDRIS